MTAVTARAQLGCDDVEPLLSPCVDGELLDDDSVTVKAHVSVCDACRARLVHLQALKAALASAGRTFDMPAGLEDQLRADVRRAARPMRAVRFAAAGVCAAGVAVVALAVAGGAEDARTLQVTELAVLGAERAERPAVVAAALQRHRLELPVDVASPDPRPVQEFLAQRLGHKLRVPHLERFGFGLQGGRVVDVEDRQGAQLVYTGGYGQRLSVVAVPDPDGTLAARFGDAGPGAARHVFIPGDDGLRVRVVQRNGAFYAIVGDLDEQRLERLSHELER